MSAIDPAMAAARLLEAVPFVGTLGVTFIDAGEVDGLPYAVIELPDRVELHNHVGGPHAGVLFSLGETASGAVVTATFGGVYDRVVPLAVKADIAYRKLAMGTVRATARLQRPPAEVLAELDSGTRPEFTVGIELATLDATVTAEMTVLWTLRPIR